MANAIRVVISRRLAAATNSIRAMSDTGHVRDAGGKLAEKERAEENIYFRKVQAQQLQELKEHHDEEIVQHEDEISRLQEKIKSHKEKLDKLNKH